MHYQHYSDSWQHTDHAALCEHNRKEGDLLARAENSGCEGFYVEVARWSFERERWERYCHFKFLGGERPGWTPKQLAEHYAREINDAYNERQRDLALIHKLPNWREDVAAPEKPNLALTLTEVYLLFQKASKETPEGPIIAAEMWLADAMRGLGVQPEDAERIIAHQKGQG